MSVACLFAEEHFCRYNEDPLVAAEKLAKIWCENQTSIIDVWGCDWTCQKFFESFLERCKEQGKLEQAVEIWWIVHNAPGPASFPCHRDYVVQWVKDYAKSNEIEIKSENIRKYGLERFAKSENKVYHDDC